MISVEFWPPRFSAWYIGSALPLLTGCFAEVLPRTTWCRRILQCVETISNAIQADASGEARKSWDLWMFIPKVEWPLTHPPLNVTGWWFQRGLDDSATFIMLFQDVSRGSKPPAICASFLQPGWRHLGHLQRCQKQQGECEEKRNVKCALVEVSWRPFCHREFGANGAIGARRQ